MPFRGGFENDNAEEIHYDKALTGKDHRDISIYLAEKYNIRINLWTRIIWWVQEKLENVKRS